MKYILIYPKQGKKDWNGQKYVDFFYTKFQHSCMLISIKEGNKDWTCNLKATIIYHVMACTKTYQKVLQYSYMLRKVCVRYFLFFHQMRALQKLREMISIPSKKFISFLRYLNFCIPVLPSFSLRRLLLYDVINCLNKNSITHFVSYHEKEKRYDIEILSRNILMDKSCWKYTPKASPWPLFSFG